MYLEVVFVLTGSFAKFDLLGQSLIGDISLVLLDNGLQGFIAIHTECIHRDGKDFIQIGVSDNGPGIAKKDVGLLFKPFSTLDSQKHLNPQGNGLGLNICKLICKSLGGDIILD